MRFNLCLNTSLWLCLVGFSTCGLAQNTTRKFDFGIGRSAKGFIPVLPSTTFTQERGYGFMVESEVSATDRGGKNKLAADYITSNKPFFFTVDLPEGIYEVKVWLGDTQGTSQTTIKVENRRLMLEKTITKQGEVLTKSFLVHIRNAQINANESVKLKPRELNYLHWDNQLTFEFGDKAPKVCGLTIKPVSRKVTTVFLAGNSTVVDQAIEPYAAWGQMIPSFFNNQKVVVANYAESGETIRSFILEKRLDKVMSQIKKGDYLFIEFAHNDQKAGSGVDAHSTYQTYLKEYISQVRGKGAIPVLVTSMYRRNFDKEGHLVNTLGDFPEAMIKVAKEENVALIDLNKLSKTLFEAMGPEKSMKAFVHYEANTFPEQTKAIHDDTHFSNYGAYQLAKCIVEGIKATKLPLAMYLRKDLPVFDPAFPDAVEQWDFPNSPLVNVIKPDGN
ncbi:rhamnogalacturonan acetylesterase [Flectobacillus major]|uniref:rhamnogalacturonan acetylesterase n=1 Tax=Flectobacillus major TaxID=103 RepID=UPI0003F930DF|nr:rhamnogalacturonan acetylesterase [Flectobacillus major]